MVLIIMPFALLGISRLMDYWEKKQYPAWKFSFVYIAYIAIVGFIILVFANIIERNHLLWGS